MTRDRMKVNVDVDVDVDVDVSENRLKTEGTRFRSKTPRILPPNE